MIHRSRLPRFTTAALPTLLPTFLLAGLLVAASLLPGEGRDGWILLADIRAANREHAAALRLYEAAGESSRYGGGLAVRIGRVHLAKGRLALAEVWLASAAEWCAAANAAPLVAILPLSHCTAEARLAQGLAYARQNRPAEAVLALRDAQATGQADAGYPLAMALLREGESESALALLKSLARGQPSAALALAFLTALDDPGAAATMLAAASTDGSTEAARLAVALPALADDSDRAERAMLVGRAALRAGLPEIGLASFAVALEVEPSWPQALAHRAYAHYLLDEDALAMADAVAALDLDAYEASAHHVRGLVLLRGGDAGAARNALEAAYAADPTNAAILCDLAYAYAELHNYEQAQSDFAAAVQLEPASPVPLMRLARFHFSTLLQVDLGLGAAREAAQKAPHSAEALHLAGWGLYLTGKPGEALAPLEQAIGLDPLSAETHFHLGQALQALGRDAQAASAFRRAADLDTTGAVEARAAAALAGLRP